MASRPSVTDSKRLLLLVVLSAGIGILSGGAAYLLVRLISLFTNLAFFGTVGWGEIPDLSHIEASPRLPIIAVLGAIVIAGIARWAPIIKGHGIPEAMEAVLRRQSRVQPRAAVAKPVSAAIAIGTGAPFGAEGPIIVTGGAIGSMVGQIVPVSPSERKILLASGAAAGMAAIFGAPLAAVLLAIELLLFEFSMRSLIPLVVASSIAGGVHTAIFENGPLFRVPVHDYAGLSNIPLYAVLGLACGLVAILIQEGLFASERFFREWSLPEFWQPAVGALGFAAIGLLVPRTLGVGTHVVESVLAGELALATLAILLVAKMVSWWIALGSGTSGGTLAPVLLMGATFGGLFAAVANEVLPGFEVNSGVYAVVAMAAVFGAATRAPFTAIVFVFELTRDFNVLLPLMMATVLAALVATALSEHSLYTEKLARRGVRVGGELTVDSLRTTPVSDVMNRVVDTFSPETKVSEVAERIARGGRGAYPLVDDEGHCIGMVSKRNLLAVHLDEDEDLTSVMTSDVVTTTPDARLVDALKLMVDEDVSHLPVINEENILMGICTRTDILRARGQEFALERLETGWLAPVLQRPGADGRRYVVVGNKTLGSAELSAAIAERIAEPGDARFHVIVPMHQNDSLSDVRGRLELQLELIDGLGARASGDVTDGDALVAIESAIKADETVGVILSTLPVGQSRWLRSDLAVRAKRQLTLPLIHVISEPGDAQS